MDLFKTRCGCGAVYSPTVKTQRVCDACGDRHRATARAKLVEARSEKLTEEIQYRAWDFSAVEAAVFGPQLERIKQRTAKCFGHTHVGAAPTVPASIGPYEYTVGDLRAALPASLGGLTAQLNTEFAGRPWDAATKQEVADRLRELRELRPVGPYVAFALVNHKIELAVMQRPPDTRQCYL